MPSNNLIPVNGVIQNISEFDNNCCMQEITIRNSDGIQNFIVSPDTYVISEVRLRIGMNVTAFYDADLPIHSSSRPDTRPYSLGGEIRRKPSMRGNSTGALPLSTAHCS